MRDIPIFTGYDGIATLILREIPYRGEGYVIVRSLFGSLQALLRECESFCRAAGAEQIYFGGNADFSGFEIHAKLIEREVLKQRLLPTYATAEKTTDEARWLEIYREKFASVPAAQTCRQAENAYDIFLNGELIGIGQTEGDRLRSVAATKQGSGADCVCALARLCQGESVRLLCAEQNERAMRLYDRLGFSVGETKEIWYKENTCNLRQLCYNIADIIKKGE